jgi:hypothetical protein
VSVQAISWVIEKSSHKGSSFVLMLVVANHAHSDGTGSYPSVETLAREARISVRQVFRLIPKLVRSGELRAEAHAGPRGTTLYSLPKMATTDILAPTDKMSSDKLSLSDKRGPHMSPESNEGKATTKKGVPNPEKRPTPFFDGFELDAELMGFANERGIDPQEEFQAFREHHKSKGNQFVDWRAAWRTWVLNSKKFSRGSHPSSQGKGKAHGNSNRGPSGAVQSDRQSGFQPDASLDLS